MNRNKISHVQIPTRITAMAVELSEWFLRENIKDWQLAGVASRELVESLQSQLAAANERVAELEAKVAQAAAVPEVCWPLVYAGSALDYIKEHYPDVYAECGDDEKFLSERKAMIDSYLPDDYVSLRLVAEAYRENGQ